MMHMFDVVLSGNFDKLLTSNIVFLGDYVDRGECGVEVFLFLAALKLNYPTTVTMLRGNHESISMNEAYNFRKEVLYKYDGDVEVFDAFS